MMSLDQTAKTWLTDTFADDVTFEEPMSRHTSFQVGGPAEALVRPKDKADLIRLVQWATEHGIAYMPLGAGSNILVRENGIQGIVILLTGCLLSIAHNKAAATAPCITAGAGVKLADVCSYALKHGLQGFNFAMGIPGTLGGSIRVNAGTSGGCMGDVVESVTLLMPQGSFRSLNKTNLAFSYRKLDWPIDTTFETGCEPIILEAVLGLQQVDQHSIKNEAGRILKQRNKHQPWAASSAGCVFKNPLEGRSAGQLIDMAGLKGKRIGDAEVSTKHANFIINKGRATANDVLALIDLIQSIVYERFHIQLETEVRIVG
ncbi:MAG: UDP-N-acetylmuramate dehydrogenase [Deltaproteobacteria bacterium]